MRRKAFLHLDMKLIVGKARNPAKLNHTLRSARILLDWLKDLFMIYTWKEFWMVVSVSTAIVGVWFVFSFMLRIQNDVARSIAIWSLIVLLTLGSAATDYLRKPQE